MLILCPLILNLKEILFCDVNPFWLNTFKIRVTLCDFVTVIIMLWFCLIVIEVIKVILMIWKTEKSEALIFGI